jgi:hypothetical protein
MNWGDLNGSKVVQKSDDTISKLSRLGGRAVPAALARWHSTDSYNTGSSSNASRNVELKIQSGRL